MGQRLLKIVLGSHGGEKYNRTVCFAAYRPDGFQLAASDINHLDMHPTVFCTIDLRVGDGAAAEPERDLFENHSLSKNCEYEEFKRALRIKSAAYAGLRH